MQVQVLVGGADVTERLFCDWDYSRSQGATLDSASLNFDDPDKQFDPKRGQELIIRDYAAPNARRWAGVITEVARTTYGLGRHIYVRAEDYKFVLEKSTVSETWRSQTAKQILADAFDSAHANLTDFDVTTYVQDGQSETMQADEMPLRELIDLLAEHNSFEWGVTPDKALIFRARDFSSSGLTFSDDGLNTAYERLVEQRPPGALTNLVIVKGDLVPMTDDDVTVSYSADGVNDRTTIHDWGPKANQTRVQVERNTGSQAVPAWTDQDVGTVGIDTLTGDGGDKDVLWSSIGGYLVWDSAPPNFSNAFRVTGRQLEQLIQVKMDLESVTTLGRTYTVVLKDRTIRDPAEAIMVAEARLNRDKKPTRVKFDTLNETLTPGQTFHLTDTRLGIDTDFVCTDLKARLAGATIAKFSVTGENIIQRPDEWTVVS